MSAIELVVQRSTLQDIIDEGDDVNYLLDLVQKNLDAILLEMKNRKEKDN